MAMPRQGDHRPQNPSRWILLTALWISAGLLAAGCSLHYHPRGRAHGYYKKNPGPVIRVSNPVPSVSVQATTPSGVTFSMAFNNHQRQIITDYYRAHYYKKKHKWKHRGRKKGMPPGLARRGHLPPGIRKQMLPRELIGQLPPPPPGTQIIFHDGQVVLLDINTNIILDVIDLGVSVQF